MSLVPGSTLALFALLLAAPAQAITFFGEDLGKGEIVALTSFPNAVAARAQFDSYLDGVSTESFEGFPKGKQAPLNLTFTGSAAPITATMADGSGQVWSVKPGDELVGGRYPTDGTNYFATTSASLSISFDTPVAAFGFDGIDIGDFSGKVFVTTSDGTASTTYDVGNTLNGLGGSVLFWGLIDTDNPFTSVTFSNTNSGTDVFGFDRMTIGDVDQVVPPVPVPATLPLVLTAMGGLAALRARRRKRSTRAA